MFWVLWKPVGYVQGWFKSEINWECLLNSDSFAELDLQLRSNQDADCNSNLNMGKYNLN